MAYVRSLDGLRAIAILLVMSVHYHVKVPFGWVGVHLFFVLSGFLITRLLVDARSEAPFAPRWAKFMARRVRRIVPLYLTYTLLLLLATMVFEAPRAWSQAMPWLLTCTLNVGYVLGRVALDDMFAHFWSLGVEMQVYLLWPVLVWTLSREALKRAVIFILLLAPLCRWALVKLGLGTFELYFFTPTLLDAFAAGAALVVFELAPRSNIAGKQSARWLLPTLAGAVVCTVGSGVLANWSAGPKFALMSAGFPYFLPLHGQYVWGYTLLDLTAALVVLACLHGKLPILEARWLVLTGQISYGLYVLHRPLLALLDQHLAPVLAPTRALSGPLLCVAYVLGSYALAWASYHLLEVRFLRPARHRQLGRRESNGQEAPGVEQDARPSRESVPTPLIT